VALLRPTVALTSGFELEAASPENLPDGAIRLSPAHNATDVEGPQLREGFRIGELGLMIRYEAGSELADLPPTYRLPNAPDWFLGMANLHGVLVPVFDLARYFGVKHIADAKPMLLVLAHGADAAGVVIDGLPARLRFDAADCATGAPVPRVLQGCVSATYLAGELSWMDLQVNVLLQRLSDELAAHDQ
jgi:chemotaxis signal transduction protein